MLASHMVDPASPAGAGTPIIVNGPVSLGSPHLPPGTRACLPHYLTLSRLRVCLVFLAADDSMGGPGGACPHQAMFTTRRRRADPRHHAACPRGTMFPPGRDGNIARRRQAPPWRPPLSYRA